MFELRTKHDIQDSAFRHLLLEAPKSASLFLVHRFTPTLFLKLASSIPSFQWNAAEDCVRRLHPRNRIMHQLSQSPARRSVRHSLRQGLLSVHQYLSRVEDHLSRMEDRILRYCIRRQARQRALGTPSPLTHQGASQEKSLLAEPTRARLKSFLRARPAQTLDLSE
jgi:hypothetical protein